MVLVATLGFEEARQCVLSRIAAHPGSPPVEDAALLDAAGRVLAEPVLADRDIPALSRSVRDGFAVRSADLPGSFCIIGEVRAGEAFQGEVGPGEAVEIMTGAPMPAGADAVVMVEHTEVDGAIMQTARTLIHGENVSPGGSEARAGAELLVPGTPLTFAGIGLLAALGRSSVKVYQRPRVAILATGDEIVELNETPLAHQIRNSNSYSLAVQVRQAGGCPTMLPIARDNCESTRELIERGLTFDLLLISGGVSAGKYDIVESVLADLGAEFFFDRVLIQPGQPLVFGAAKGKFFFGLPGNPGSTMVTFQLFGRTAIQLLSKNRDAFIPLPMAKLACAFRQKPGLTRFLPARSEMKDGRFEIAPVKWHGSGDLPALALANCFLVTEPDRETWQAGDMIRVLFL